MKSIVKHVISIVMSITVLSTIGLISPLNFNAIKVSAYEYELSDLKMETPGGSSINLYENDNYTKELDSSKSLDSTYYGKISSDRSKVVFRTNGFSGVVKIFKDRNSKVYDEGDEIPVLTGKTTFYIRLYDTYNNEGSNECKREYKVTVKKYTSDQEEEIKNDNQDKIYLQSLELDYGNIPIGFDRTKPSYNVKVDNDVKSISIKAEPEDGATTVKINNITVDENDDYKKMVNIDKGNNKIEITLSQDDEKRTYIVNVNRKENSDKETQTNNSGDNKTDSINNENNFTDSGMPNRWMKVADKWRYNDGLGKPIRNSWFYDSNYEKNYYFNSNGEMVTGWLKLDSNWYYLNSNGAMETGWKNIGGKWYYLDYDGKMKTGWFKDSDGSYYYLDESTGAMAHDTNIGRYRLGSNGSWIK